MIISKLDLLNFRNHKEFSIIFQKDINLIAGENGSGKTSILEAISLLSTLRSPRGSLINQMIKNGEDTAIIEALIADSQEEKTIKVMLKKNGDKRVSVNRHELRRATELLGIFKSVFLSLEDINLVNGGPQNRRRFLDVILVQSSKEYKYNMQNYIEVVRQKNELIRRVNDTKAKQEELDIWDERTAYYGSKIIKERQGLIDSIEWLIKDMYDKLSSKKETIDLSYISLAEENRKGTDEKNIYEEFLRQIKKNRQKELKFGMAIIGPHRDDIHIKINKHKVTGYASTGQERSITVSFKMAEVEYFKKLGGNYPVILVDDCFVELDRERKQRIWRELDDKTQIILASTSKDEYIGERTSIFTYDLFNSQKEGVCIN